MYPTFSGRDTIFKASTPENVSLPSHAHLRSLSRQHFTSQTTYLSASFFAIRNVIDNKSLQSHRSPLLLAADDDLSCLRLPTCRILLTCNPWLQIAIITIIACYSLVILHRRFFPSFELNELV